MITTKDKIINSYRKMEVTKDNKEFLEQVSILIIRFPTEPGNQMYEEYISDVFIRFSQKLNNFVKSYRSCGHKNLLGFLHIYIKHLFFNAYKKDRMDETPNIWVLYNFEQNKEILFKQEISEENQIQVSFLNQLNVIDRLILFLRYDTQLCEFDRRYLKKILENSSRTIQEIYEFMDERREKIRLGDQMIINRISKINYQFYNNMEKVYKYDLLATKRKLYRRLWHKKEYYSVDETAKLLNISRYKVNQALKRFASIQKTGEPGLSAA